MRYRTHRFNWSKIRKADSDIKEPSEGTHCLLGLRMRLREQNEGFQHKLAQRTNQKLWLFARRCKQRTRKKAIYQARVTRHETVQYMGVDDD